MATKNNKKQTRKADRQSPAARRVPRWVVGAGLLVLALLVWGWSIDVPFHFDDQHTVQSNREIRHPTNIYRFMGDFFTRGLLKVGYTLNYQIAPTKSTGEPYAEPFHLVNILLHAINTFLVFLVLQNVLSRRYPDQRRVGEWSALIAALWAVLPLHSMTVILIASRAIMQAWTFGLLSLYLALRATERDHDTVPRLGLITGAWLSLLMAIASKNVAIAVLPLLGLLMLFITPWRPDWSNLSETDRKRLKILGVSLGVGVGLAVMLLVILQVSGEAQQTLKEGEDLGAFGNLLTQSGVILRYAFMTVIPYGLSIEHDVPAMTSLWPENASLWGNGPLPPLLTLGLLVGVGVLGLWLLYRRSAAGMAICWFGVLIAPSSSIIPRAERMLEYRAYLASLGIVALAVIGIYALGRAVARRFPEAPARYAPTVLVAVLVLVYGRYSVQRIQIFKDPVALWSDAVQIAPNRKRSRSNLGASLQADLVNVVSPRQKRRQLEDAVKHLRYALKIDPEYTSAMSNLGVAYRGLGRNDKAVDIYKRALDVDNELANTHHNIAVIYGEQGKDELAMDHYRQAIEHGLKLAETHYNYAILLDRHGRREDAIAHYRQALKLNPGFPRSYINLGRLLYDQGDKEEAEKFFRKAINLSEKQGKPSPEANYNMAVISRINGRLEKAMQYATTAIAARRANGKKYPQAEKLLKQLKQHMKRRQTQRQQADDR